MMSSWAVWHVETGGKRFKPATASFVLKFAEFPSKVFYYFFPNTKDSRWIVDSSNANGFNYLSDTSGISAGYLLISTFNEKNNNPSIKLVNVKNAKTEWLWEINIDTALKYTYSAGAIDKSNLRLFHPVLLKDKSIIFNTSYSLVKIDSNSNIVWSKRGIFHHAIEKENDSIVWVPLRLAKSKLYRFNETDTLYDDALCSINTNTGNAQFEKSVAQVLIENGYSNILNSGQFENDLVHLNEIQPAPYDSKYWKKGDLLVSARNKNVVFLYHPATNKISWLMDGPWIGQHDCSFIDSGRLLIFGNDLLRLPHGDTLLYGHNNAYIFDFKANKTSTPFTRLFENMKIQTRTEGRCDLLSNGDLFVCETNSGRIIIGDTSKPKIIYVERVDKEHIKMFNLVRYVPTLPFKNNVQ